MRDTQLNSQYLVLFKNCRDVNQIKVLSNQMGLPHLPESYRKVTSQAYQPLVVDMRPGTPDYLRVMSFLESTCEYTLASPIRYHVRKRQTTSTFGRHTEKHEE